MTDATGWKALLAGSGRYGAGRFPLPAYSEFMPPPRLGRKPYGEPDIGLFAEDDPSGWRISEREQAWELQPGLEHIARELYTSVLALAAGREAPLIRGHNGRNVDGNPYWPEELAARAGALTRERFVSLSPLALSRTQDDKGRVRWTLLGSSEQGPERAFWRSFAAGSGGDGPAFLCRLLREAYGEDARDAADLRACGLRVLAAGPHHPHEDWADELPAWAERLAVTDGGPFEDVRFLLTFRPFAHLPAAVRRAYLELRLHLLPFPGTLAVWGAPPFLRLAGELPSALQIPLLRLTRRWIGAGIKIPQSGWLHEPGPRKLVNELHGAHMRETFTRTHRWDRVDRHEDELATLGREDRIARVLFSNELEVIGLYDKPMARNAQIWSDDFHLVLDGPRSGRDAIARARERVLDGGTFGYRFQYPPMRVGEHEVTWHLPLAAYATGGDATPTLISDGPQGYLVASPVAGEGRTEIIELVPRLLRRPLQLAAVTGLHRPPERGARHEAANVLAVASAWQQLGERPLPRTFARRVLKLRRDETVDSWLGAFAERLAAGADRQVLRDELERLLEPSGATAPDGGAPALTYGATATRPFEEALWRDIATLAHGEYLTKDNADCVLDAVTQAQLPHRRRDLEPLGDYLLGRHRDAIAAAGMSGRAWCGELPFVWETDFEFPHFGGWLANREGRTHERDIVAVIPGRDRGQAVVLADHYDTAYMEDVYDTSKGGSGARLAAHGADDNHSATATLLQAAPVFLRLASEGRLERDVWLVHLTGEEFPADCMGARALCRALVEGTLALDLGGGERLDLTPARVVGLVVMDMIAHNRADHPYVFQISPGDGPGSLRVALQAHLANEAWNRLADTLNASPERRGRGPSQRSADPANVPGVAEHPHLRGEVRLHFDPRSSLYNTDGQIFSDVGVPAALFMEDYDITREGYHDTHDTMENIDLDYGAGVAAIAIETIARLATANTGHRA